MNMVRPAAAKDSCQIVTSAEPPSWVDRRLDELGLEPIRLEHCLQGREGASEPGCEVALDRRDGHVTDQRMHRAAVPLLTPEQLLVQLLPRSQPGVQDVDRSALQGDELCRDV